jgi:hypothetical protein
MLRALGPAQGGALGSPFEVYQRRRRAPGRQHQPITTTREDLPIMARLGSPRACHAGGHFWGQPPGRSARHTRDMNVPLRGPSFAWCCAWRTSHPDLRQAMARTKQAACHYRRVAKLSITIGKALDDAGIAYRWIRYVAFGDGATAQQARFEEVMLRHGRTREAAPSTTDIGARLPAPRSHPCSTPPPSH